MKDRYADVILDIVHEKLDRPFLYRIPKDLWDEVTEGVCVSVPFGRGNKLKKGYVTACKSIPEYDPEKIKDIAEVVKTGVSIEERQMQLALFLRRSYGGTMIQALKTVLPAKRTVQAVIKKQVTLLLSAQEAEEALIVCEKKHRTAMARLLRELLLFESLPMQLVTGKLAVSAATVKAMERQGMIRVTQESRLRNPIRQKTAIQEEKSLSPEQQKIVDTLLQDFDEERKGTYLLHGITGSGKTEVYIKAIEGMVKRGKQAIVLIPEIALTYQTLKRFYSRFGERVSVLNSSLSLGEKYDQCERAKRGEIDVIIGPRSALFTPFPDLGLIVMDEEHESSYKSESAPKYHARETAVELARLSGASVLLGSATPSMESYYRVRTGEYRLFTLDKRLTGAFLPTVYTVDLREELKQGNRSIFSKKLQELMTERLEKKQQVMLFLNRRGYAGFISCRSCGHVMKCPHCDVSLSEHKGGRLICHYCGYEERSVSRCPSCGSPYISGFRAGTQQIEEKLRRMYPDARILRMDADTTRTKDSYEKILSAFSLGEADILVGTQMIVKGHDFPNVTLVGVLAADLSLSAGDYRAGERTFALLTQAAGRAGRGTLAGEVVIQTYQPEHYSVVHAAKQDYLGFYEEEILYREMLRYPPVCHMLAVQIFAGREENGEALARELAKAAGRFVDGTEPIQRRMTVIGPAPAGIGKLHDIFRFVFYIKYEKYDKLIEIKDNLETLIQGMNLRTESVQMDFDPVNGF